MVASRATSGVCPASHAVTVLFVDDDADTRFAYRLIATEAGMIVELASSGSEALALANVLSLDVIVLDVGLSSRDGLDGFEVARRLRASSRTSAIPVVFLSGHDGPDDLARVRASGCEGHLVKPCSADALLALVTDLARGRRDLEVRGATRASIA
jgi:CheY-like chemotaxis protein